MARAEAPRLAALRWLVALTTALTLLAAGSLLWHERNQALDMALTLGERRAAALADELQSTLELAQTAQRGIEQRLQALPADADLAPAWAAATADIAPVLARLPLPLLVQALGADGRSIAGAAAGRVGNAERLPLPGGAAWQVEPTRGGPGQRVVALLRAAAPNRVGVAAFLVTIDHAALLRRFDDSRETVGGGAALFRVDPDGATTLLARAPHRDAELGLRVRGPLADALPHAARGSFQSRTQLDGVHRLVAFHRLQGDAAALVVGYGMATEDILASWWPLLHWGSGVTLLLLTALFVGGYRLDRTLQALQRSENHFRTLATNLPDVVLRLDADGRHRYANDAAQQATGLAPQDLIGRTLADLGQPDELVARWLATVRQVLDQRRPARLEYAMNGPQGLRQWESMVAPEPVWRRGEAPTVLVISRDITERHRAEAERREASARFEKLFIAAPEAISLSALDSGRFVQVNAAFCELFGYAREDVIGRTSSELALWTSPGGRQRVTDRLRAGEPVHGFEGVGRQRSGALVDVLYSAEQVEFGGTACLLLVFRDISQRKAAEAALRRSELRFRLAAASGQVWEWDFGAGGVNTSSGFLEALGHPSAEPSRLVPGFEAVVHPDDLGSMKAALVRHLKQQAPYQVQFRAVDSAGEQRWFESRGQAVWDDHGRATYMAGTTFDITKRRRAEDQVRALAAELEQRVIERTEQLARSEARYRTIFETVPVAIAEEDWSGVQALLRGLRTQGVDELAAHFANQPGLVGECLRAVQVRQLNRQALALYEAHDRPPGTTGLEAFYPRAEDLPQFAVELQALWSGQRRFSARRSLRGVNGEQLSLMLTMSLPALGDDDGTALVCMVDITEIDRLNAELDRSLGRLRQANQELETFTYSVSHDLKAPLRGIDGYSRLLLDDHGEQLDAEGREFLGHIRRATQHMGQLIDDLLAYSRLERRSLTLASQTLAAVVDRVCTGFEREFAAAGVEFEVRVDPALRVLADAQGLSMALRNLVDNALKFSRSRSPPRIVISAAGTPEGVSLTVRDNGVGFDMKFHDRIFSIFQRLHRAEDYPGTGIGLAIVHKAMQRMGGSVSVHSQPDHGATFTLHLPAADPP